MKKYQICTRCIMDTSDPDISFNNNGVCNHCRSKTVRQLKTSLQNEREKQLPEIIDRIKQSGKNKEYDCILGLSGGVDSSYVAYLAKTFSLKPFVIHIDNGWDSEISTENVNNIAKKLNLELYNYTIDWSEFKDLQRAFLYASVVDIEMLSDHAIIATLYRMAKKKSIKYILTGYNYSTENVLPEKWYHTKVDLKNVKAIYKIHSNKKVSNFPTINPFKYYIYYPLLGIKKLPILNFLNYNKKDAINILKKELDWKEYGNKHDESIITRFYQSYILPQKFGIDKRRMHLSSLIHSGQMTRKEALLEIKQEIYPRDKMLEDKKYFLNKLELTEREFENIMKLPVKSHFDYPNNQRFWGLLKKIRNLVKI